MLSFFQIHIVDGDALITEPWKEMQKIESFLQVNPYFGMNHFAYSSRKRYYCFKKSELSGLDCLRKKKGHHYSPLEPHLRNKLEEYFRPHNEKFFTMIGRRFDWNN